MSESIPVTQWLDLLAKVLGVIGGLFGGVPKIVNRFSKPYFKISRVNVNVNHAEQLGAGAVNLAKTRISWFIHNNRKLFFLGKDVKDVVITYHVEKEVDEDSVWNFVGEAKHIKFFPMNTRSHREISFGRAFPQGNYNITLRIEAEDILMKTYRDTFRV